MPTAADMNELRIWLGKTDADDDVLELLLRRAKSQILNYCNREDFPEPLRYTMINLAVIYYNRLGVEGQSSNTEGLVSVQYGVLNVDIPDSIRKEMQRFRKVGIPRAAE